MLTIHVQKDGVFIVNHFKAQTYLIGQFVHYSYFLLGITVFALVILVIIIKFIKRYNPHTFRSNFDLLLGISIFVFSLLLVKIMLMVIMPDQIVTTAHRAVYMYYVPLFSCAMSAILYGILMNVVSGYIFMITLCFCQTILYGGDFVIFLISIFSATVGIMSSHNARRRTHLIKSGMLIGLIQSLSIGAYALAIGLPWQVIVIHAATGIANGSLGAFFTAGILPIFEYVFKVTTDIRLLELSDLNHPLLKKLVLDAPGTYHHSLIVGNLAEAAAEVVGAKPLLARVGAYFHDIGKLKKPEYFSENEWRGKSRHDDLIPSMSSLIIISHVKDGVDLARKHGLNKNIVDIIEQHHGTSLVYFFYKRAQNARQEADQKLNEEEFRYPGPTPMSKEAAIILLADAVEAASRSLDNPTPSRIKNLVTNIINARFLDSQLDQCQLTVKDLAKIKDCFTYILTGIFHTRPKYPKDDDSDKPDEKQNEHQNKQQPETVQDIPESN